MQGANNRNTVVSSRSLTLKSNNTCSPDLSSDNALNLADHQEKSDSSGENQIPDELLFSSSLVNFNSEDNSAAVCEGVYEYTFGSNS